MKVLNVSRWSEIFEAHPVHEVIKQSNAWLESTPDEPDAELEIERHRLMRALNTISETLQKIDTEFFPSQLLDNINNGLRHQHFYNQLNAYSSSPSLDCLKTANNQITTIAPQVYQLAALNKSLASKKMDKASEAALTSFTKTIDKSTTKANEQISTLSDKLSQIEAKTNSLSSEYDALKSTISSQQLAWQENHSENQTKRMEEYSNDQLARKRSFEELTSSWKKEIEVNTGEISARYEEDLNSKLNLYIEQGATKLADIDQKYLEVVKLHGLVGRDSVTGGYKNTADEEKGSANLWRKISMGGFIVAAVWLAIKYFNGLTKASDGSIQWTEIVTSVSLTSIILLIAGYASKQSKFHRENEHKMRWFELETAALDPFIADLSPEQQQSIKTEMIRRMFGQQRATNTNELKLNEGNLKTIVDTIAENVSKALPNSDK